MSGLKYAVKADVQLIYAAQKKISYVRVGVIRKDSLLQAAPLRAPRLFPALLPYFALLMGVVHYQRINTMNYVHSQQVFVH